MKLTIQHYFFVLLICLIYANPLVSQQSEWVIGGLGTGDFADISQATGIGNDSSDNSYVVGSITGTHIFTNDTLTDEEGSSFLVKLDSEGSVLWSQVLRSTGTSEIRAIEVELGGGFYITGLVVDTLFFGMDTFSNSVSSNSNDIFLAKYSKEGDEVWAKRIPGPLNDAGNSLAVSNGQVYVCGEFTHDTYFTTDTIRSWNTQIPDFFVAKFSGVDGTEQWVRGSGSTPAERGTGIVVDSDGFIYATGTFMSLTRFDTVMLTSQGFIDFFLVKYNPLGDLIWAKSWGSTLDDFSTGLAIDETDRMYMGGHFLRTMAMGADTLVAPDAFAVFVSQIQPDGTVSWARQSYPSSMSNSFLEDLAVSPEGNTFLTGWYQAGDLTFGTDTVNHEFSGRTFVSSFGPDGTHDWLIQDVADSPDGRSVGEGIAVCKSGQVCVAGYFVDSIQWGANFLTGMPFNTGTNTDSYIVKVGPGQAMAIDNLLSGKVRQFSRIYPNPSDGKFAFIEYDLPSTQSITLQLFDLQGREVITANFGIQPQNVHTILVETRDLESGIYFYQLSGPAFFATGKYMVSK